MRRSTALSLTAALAAGAWLAARRLRRRRPLAGGVALVTGGSRGLGLVLARELGRRGMRIVLCARDEEELERARGGLAQEGIDATALPGDVTDEDGMRTLVADVEENLGPVDLLVNSAGIIQVGPAEAMAVEDYRHAMDVLFFGPLHAAEAVLPGMRARRRGTIVNVTSIGAAVGIPHLAPYDAAKFAARGWSEALGAEAAKHGIDVITVVPGLMRTGSFGRALVKGRRYAEASLFSLLASLPLVTVSAERAARRIVRAIEHGERFVIIGLPARLLRLAHSIMPGAIVAILGFVNRFLPTAAPGARHGIALPAELFRRGLARSILTALGERAARRYNEEPA
ncbi:SDR family NAD(P)-dependent oxidoreductase [Anaeromyxobacter dehalogenans]|uniref:Short-chain dehydrogenase/reductase SDR n=1 Tax=Anaeromyxobacter dehalogenans (strain 2CP-C) TaxID=290397 RepID=Q2ILY0_ANADE|nr:SDR family oxidoreductase [Anaeromyxobacter dehalogenans]ABC79809.1 short-chain dehydrogenase/reductase SDR [Anaeromyxobacter dehalogenans 2CP-C]